MNNISLPKRVDGKYLDLYARIYESNQQLLESYADKIRQAYKVDEFEIKTESHGILKFHRDFNYLRIDMINHDKLMYNIYEEGFEYLGKKLTGTVLINRKEKKFRIQIFYQDDKVEIEKRGLATEIWKKAIEIMERIGIEDYSGYTIETMVDVATKHLLSKLGNPFNQDR